jgi:Leucine-rich repeat (LRR) protein
MALYLNFNKIKHIDGQLFKKQSNLYELNIKNNKIKKINKPTIHK